MSELPNASNGMELSDVERLLAEYVVRLNAGEDISIETIKSRHPALAEELIEQLRLLQDLHKDATTSLELGTLGDYTLRRQIGRGGMGVVYDAWQNSMDRRVALKVLPVGIAADDKSFSRFMREARAAGKLNHPNVVAVHAMGQDEHTPYFAMEYVEGETLGQVLAKVSNTDGTPQENKEFLKSLSQRFTEAGQTSAVSKAEPDEHTQESTTKRPAGIDASESAYYLHLCESMASVADGLQHAHSKGVIHRDIKPSNLILDCHGRLRILDFGLARLEGQATITISGDFVGTPLYVSPEQAKRRAIPVDHRTDIYSLGATMYEMLVWKPPFRGEDARDTLTQIIESDPAPVRRLNSSIPHDLETIILKCLRKDPSDRYSSAAALALDLRRFVRGDPIEARPQSTWEKLALRLQRSRVRLAVSAIAFAVVAIVGYLTLMSERTAIGLLWEAAVDDHGAPFMGAVSPDGRHLSYADWVSGNLAIRKLSERENLTVTKEASWTPPVRYVEGSIWSPDSEQLAYAWYDDDFHYVYQLRTIKLNESTPRILYRDPEITYIRPGDWSGDGRSIFAVFQRLDENNQIVQVSVADGSVRVLKSVDRRWPHPLRRSPDDDYLAYSYPPDEHSSEHDVYVLTSDGTKGNRVVQHPADDKLLGWLPDGKRIIFTSDRRGSVDLWSIEIADGEATGSAQLVKAGIGSCEPLGFAQGSAFYYGSFTRLNDVYVASLYPETGKLEAEPTRVTEFFEGKNERPDWSSDGNHLAYVSKRTPGGGFDFILRSLETGQEKLLRLSVSFERIGIRLSPDASSALVLGRDAPGSSRRGIYKLDTQSGVLSPFLSDSPESRLSTYLSACSWSAEGQSVFYVRWENGIARLIEHSLDTPEETVIYRATAGREIMGLVPSPNGARLAFSTIDDSPPRTFAIHVLSVKGGEPQELVVRQKTPTWPIAWTPDGANLLFVEREQHPNDRLAALWRISSSGGQPQKLNLDVSGMRQLRMHPDGRRLAFVMGQTRREVWKMEQFQSQDGAAE